MHNGFYKTKEKELSFEFLENVHTSYYRSAMDFLHGFCHTFAYVVSKHEGYPIIMRRLRNPLPHEADIIHCWCVDGCDYIDVRGKTAAWSEFWDEFEDFDMCDPEDEEFETLVFDNAKDFFKELEGSINYESFGTQILTAAENLFSKYHDYYAVE